jgi:hypothetical protein
MIRFYTFSDKLSYKILFYFELWIKRYGLCKIQILAGIFRKEIETGPDLTGDGSLEAARGDGIANMDLGRGPSTSDLNIKKLGLIPDPRDRTKDLHV